MKTTFLLCVALTLAGCSGGGPSVSGTASEGSGSSSGLAGSWESARGVGLDNTRTVEMPALGLMADAFMADFSARGASLTALTAFPLLEMDGAIARLDKVIADMAEPLRGVALEPGSAARKASPLDPVHQVYAAPLGIALQPRKGWDVNAMEPSPAFDHPFFRERGHTSDYDPKLHRRYMELLAGSAIYTDAVFSLIDQQLGTTRLADPDAARHQVLLAFQKIPPETLQQLLRDAAEQMEDGGFTTDLTGSGNIHFIHSAAGDFVGDARGVTWTRAGGVRFGDGRIGGQVINLRLASTASLSRRQAQSGTQGMDSNARVEGSGSVGVGR